MESVDGIVRGVCRGWSRIGMDYDDLSQFCRLKLIERHAEYDSERGTFPTWARMVSQSECRRLWRVHCQLHSSLGEGDEPTDFSPRPQQLAENRERDSLLRLAVESLPFTQRAVIERFCGLAGHPPENLRECAVSLGWSNGDCQRLFAEGIESLRHVLGDSYAADII